MEKMIIYNEEFKSNPYSEKYLYSVNRDTFSKQSSSSLYNKYFSDKLLKEESLYLMVGTDSGLLLNYIMQQELPKNTRYLFIELPHLIEKIESTLPDEYDKDTFVITTIDKWKEVAADLEISIYIYKDSVRYIKSLAVVDSFLIEYNAINQRLSQELETMFFFTRAMVGVYPFMTKQLMNISDNRISSTVMNNCFAGESCIILGGGPSLDEEIEWIKANQNNIVLIAVSRIAKLLLSHNITPHLIVSVDPYDVSFDVSKEQLLLPEKVLFLQANCVNPSLLAQWHGRSIYIGKRFPWEEKSDEDTHSLGGPTVTNTALKAAIEMGFTTVLLAGVDLCHSKSGVTHASKSIEANVGPLLGQPGVWVETYAGDMAETQIAFNNAVSSLSAQAEDAKKDGVTIYNLSKNAAKAKYIDYIPTSALSFDAEHEDIWGKIQSNTPHITPDLIRKDNNFTLTKVSKMLTDLQKVKRLAEEALECNINLFQTKGKESDNFKYKLRMDKIEKTLDSHYKKTTAFIKNFGLDKFVKSAQTSHEDWSDEKVEETGRLYYQAYIDSSNALVQLLQQTLERIKSRIEEEKSIPNFKLLFEQWRKDKHYGRAVAWKNNTHHQSIELPAAYQEQANEFTELFEKILSNDDTEYLKEIQMLSSLSWVKRKIIILYNQHNTNAIQVIAESLRQHINENDEYKNLHLLAEAYYSLLTKKYPEALQCFEMLPSEEIELDELQQIANLYLKLSLHDEAEDALKKLSMISHEYTPQYAKILRLRGKNQQSIDVYSEYLAEQPNDVEAWLELGKLYFNNNLNESAKIAFQCILQQDPTHILASEYLTRIH
jgi:hypothetical protein